MPLETRSGDEYEDDDDNKSMGMDTSDDENDPEIEEEEEESEDEEEENEDDDDDDDNDFIKPKSKKTNNVQSRAVDIESEESDASSTDDENENDSNEARFGPGSQVTIMNGKKGTKGAPAYVLKVGGKNSYLPSIPNSNQMDTKVLNDKMKKLLSNGYIYNDCAFVVLIKNDDIKNAKFEPGQYGLKNIGTKIAGFFVGEEFFAIGSGVEKKLYQKLYQSDKVQQQSKIKEIVDSKNVIPKENQVITMRSGKLVQMYGFFVSDSLYKSFVSEREGSKDKGSAKKDQEQESSKSAKTKDFFSPPSKKKNSSVTTSSSTKRKASDAFPGFPSKSSEASKPKKTKMLDGFEVCRKAAERKKIQDEQQRKKNMMIKPKSPVKAPPVKKTPSPPAANASQVTESPVGASKGTFRNGEFVSNSGQNKTATAKAMFESVLTQMYNKKIKQDKGVDEGSCNVIVSNSGTTFIAEIHFTTPDMVSDYTINA